MFLITFISFIVFINIFNVLAFNSSISYEQINKTITTIPTKHSSTIYLTTLPTTIKTTKTTTLLTTTKTLPTTTLKTTTTTVKPTIEKKNQQQKQQLPNKFQKEKKKRIDIGLSRPNYGGNNNNYIEKQQNYEGKEEYPKYHKNYYNGGEQENNHGNSYYNERNKYNNNNNEYIKKEEYNERNYEKPNNNYYPEQQKNVYNNEENYNYNNKKEYNYNNYNNNEMYEQQKQIYSGNSPWSIEYNKRHSYDSHYCSVHGSFSLALATNEYNNNNAYNYGKGEEDKYNNGYKYTPQSRYHTRQFCRFTAAISQKACHFCCKIVARSANTSPDEIVSAIFKFDPLYPSANGAGISSGYDETTGYISTSLFQCVCCAPKQKY